MKADRCFRGMRGKNLQLRLLSLSLYLSLSLSLSFSLALGLVKEAPDSEAERLR